MELARGCIQQEKHPGNLRPGLVWGDVGPCGDEREGWALGHGAEGKGQCFCLKDK